MQAAPNEDPCADAIADRDENKIFLALCRTAIELAPRRQVRIIFNNRCYI